MRSVNLEAKTFCKIRNEYVNLQFDRNATIMCERPGILLIFGYVREISCGIIYGMRNKW